MPRIPRLEQTQRVEIAAQPSMSPDALTGPGRALQQLGSSIGSLGAAFASQQDDTAQFEAQLAVQKWNNELDMNELQFRSTYSGDGKDYYPQRAEYFESTIPDLQAKIANAPPAFQRKAALLIEQKRGAYGEGAYRYGDEVRSNNLFAETMASITGDFAKVSGATPEEIKDKLMSALSGINAQISRYPGNEGRRELLREHAAKLLTEKILNDKTIPDYMKPQALDALMGEWAKTQAAPPPGPQSSLPAGSFFEGRVPTASERREIFKSGGVVVNLDSNWSDRKDSQTGPLVVIPDGATPAQRQAAQAYANAVAGAYKEKFGTSLPAKVVTRSQNGRGRDGTIHTEPFAVTDTKAVDYFVNDAAGRAKLAEITKATLGTIPGVKFSLPHDPAKGDRGAHGPRGSEVEFASKILAEMRGLGGPDSGQEAPGAIRPTMTAYSPQNGGDKMEGGYASSKPGPDGKAVVRTLADVSAGRSQYVTLAGDPSQYGKTYIIPEITYKDASGKQVTLKNVKGVVHDTGSAFKGKGDQQFDIPVDRDLPPGSLGSQPFSKKQIAFVPEGAKQSGLTRVASLDPAAGVGQPQAQVTGQQPPSKITEVLKGTPEEKAAKLRELVARGYQDIVHQVDADGNDVIVAKQGDKPTWQRGRRGTDAEGRIPNELDNDQFAGPSWANGVVADMKAGKIERVQTADQSGRIPSMRPSVEAKAAEIIMKQRDVVQARAVASTKALVERAEKVATEGKMLPDEERAVVEQAIAAVKSPELALKYQIAVATAQETSRLRTLRPDQIQARAIELNAAIAAAGQKATPEMLARASAVEKLAKHVSTQLDKDMLAWGQESGIIPALEKIDPASPDLAVLQQRAQAAQVLGERYGRPPQFFTSEEREIMTKVMAEGGEAMIQRLGVMAEAFGDGMPAAMAEIAKDAPEAATLGWLIHAKGDTQTINDLSDAVAMKARKDKSYDVYAVQDKDALFNGRTEIATAFMGSPQTQKRVLDLASALYQVRAFRAGKDPKAGVDAKMYQQAVRDVLGETTDPKSGVKYGGIYKQGSWFSGPYSQNIVIPPNVRQDKFSELVSSIRSQDLIKGGVPALPSGMEAPKDADVSESAAASRMMARGAMQTPLPSVTLGTPLDSKGRPISAGALQNMTLVSVGEGKYQIAQGDPASSEPKFVAEMGPDGRLREYVLDLKQLEPLLKQRRPDLYKPE